MQKCNDNTITSIEKKYDVLGIESVADAMWYLNCKREKLGILTIHNDEKTCVILNKSQAKVLLSELQGIIEVVFD